MMPIGIEKPRKKLMQLSNNEKTMHNNFISEMKDPLWRKIK